MCGPIIESTVDHPYLFFLLLFFFSLAVSIILHRRPVAPYFLISIASFLLWVASIPYFLGTTPCVTLFINKNQVSFLVHLGSTISSTCVFHPHAKPTQVWHRSCRKSHTNSLSIKHFQIQRPGVTKPAFGKRHLVHSLQHHLSDLECVTSVGTFHQGFIGPSSRKKNQAIKKMVFLSKSQCGYCMCFSLMPYRNLFRTQVVSLSFLSLLFPPVLLTQFISPPLPSILIRF